MANYANLLAKLDKEASDRDADCPTGKCPKKTPGIIVMVARSDTADAISGVEVDISKPTKQKKPTGGDGMARFTPAKLGTHVARLSLSADLARRYSPVAAREVSTQSGKTTTLLMLLSPLPSFQVVVKRSDINEIVSGAKVELTGPEALNSTTATGSGIATFQRLKPGHYDVKITLTQDHLKTLLPPIVVKKTVLVGETAFLQVLVHPRGKADPVLRIADPKVVLLKRDYMDKAKSKAKPHRLPVEIGVSAKFDGTGRLTCNLPAKIKLFETAEGGTAKAFPLQLSAGQLNQGLDGGKPLTFFLEAAEPSGGMNDVQLNLELQGGKVVVGAPVTDKLTCVRLKLDICKWRVDDATAPAPMAEADKTDKARYIHEQNEELHHERARVIVHKAEPAGFTGTLRLQAWDEPWEAASDKVQFFDAEKPAKGQVARPLPLDLPNAGIPGTGQELWLQGKAVSDELLDTALRLGLDNLPDDGKRLVEGDRAMVTVIQTLLTVYRSKPAASGSKPQPMTEKDQISTGRYLHKQDAKFHHGRAKLVLAKAKPDGFKEKLRLSVWDVTAKSESNPRLKLFEQEVAASGQAAAANPVEVDYGAAFPAAGKVWWVEGATASGALRDTEIRLALADHMKTCGRGALTVVEFTKLKVTIKSTPANTARAGHAAPADHTHEVSAYEEDFTDNATLVLMRNAQPDIALEVTTKPDRPVAVPILWRAVRNKDDHANLGDNKKLPTVTPDGADKRKAVLNANEKGSFHVRPYIDCNGVDEYSPGEPSLPLSLILADVTVVQDNSAGLNGNLTAAGAAGGVNVTNGTWPAGWAAATSGGGAGMTMELVADVTGGGADGRVGLDKVFGGLVNMLRGNDIRLTYRDSTGGAPADYVVRNRYVLNKADATGNYGGAKLFKPGDPAPNLLVFPVLDTGRSPGGLGGETAVMGRSGVWDPAPSNRPVGKRYTLRCIDSPGRGFLRRHPNHPSALLFQIHYVQQFRANFCFWTNITQSRGQTGDPADRVYSVVRTMDWDVTADWSVNSTAAVPVLTVTNAHVISVTGPATIDPIGRAQDHAVEVRPPSGITDAIAWETT